jgi:rhodanese-related sulfurtransferase
MMEWKDLTPTEARDHVRHIEGLEILNVGGGASGLPQAIKISLNELRQDHSNLDPSKPYLVVSDDGAASLEACVILAEAGFDHLCNLQGGLRHWSASGLSAEDFQRA